MIANVNKKKQTNFKKLIKESVGSRNDDNKENPSFGSFWIYFLCVCKNNNNNWWKYQCTFAHTNAVFIKSMPKVFTYFAKTVKKSFDLISVLTCLVFFYVWKRSPNSDFSIYNVRRKYSASFCAWTSNRDLIFWHFSSFFPLSRSLCASLWVILIHWFTGLQICSMH